MMTYQEAVSYIEEIPMFAKKQTIDHTTEFLKRLGNPLRGQRVIHVAGTNGKGSVCAYLQAMLMADGKCVGLFTSPHLEKINERICLNGQPVDDERFLKAFLHTKKVVDDLIKDGFSHPAYFEFLFGMGMVIYQELCPDYVILETGLGGRLDATNSVKEPVLTVITSISLDHTQYLGDTIESIAREKAGIIKPGAPVVFDGSSPEASRIIRKKAFECRTECREITNHAFEIREITDKHIAFLRTNPYDNNVVWRLSNSGIYQAMNASLAIAAMEELQDGTPDQRQYDRWREAIEQVVWPGRMEEILPGVYVDGAHNPGAIEAFCDSVNALGADHRLPVILFSVVADKEYEQMIADLCRKLSAKAYVVTEIEGSRRVPAVQLKNLFERYTDAHVYATPDVSEAWELALSLKDAGGKLYCLGSLYLVGMIKGLSERRDG